MRTILLCHQPDPKASGAGFFSAHFDWLVELTPEPDPDSRTIATWRLAQRPDCLAVGQTLRAEAIASHRAFYLDLLAPKRLSGDRGLVYPVARGTVVRDAKKAEQLLLDLCWANGGMQRLAISPDVGVQCVEMGS